MENTVFMVEILGLLIAVGAMGGFLSGLLGIGGGVIFVPALFFTLESLDLGGVYAMHLVVAASLMIVAVTVVVSARGHYLRGALDRDLLKTWAPFATMGVITGAFFASDMDKQTLQGVFAVLTLFIALYMGFGREKMDGVRASFLTPLVQRVLALCVGFLSALAGIGGASVMVPLVTLMGRPMHKAVGTSAALGFFIALPGVVTYIITGWSAEGLPAFSTGFVNWPLAFSVAIPSMLAAPLGVKISHRLDRKVLRRIFAVVLVFVSLKMFWSL